MVTYKTFADNAFGGPLLYNCMIQVDYSSINKFSTFIIKLMEKFYFNAFLFSFIYVKMSSAMLTDSSVFLIRI
jgi:hypothetical protein